MLQENFIEKKELKPAKIELHFFRHSIKGSDNVALPNDAAVTLSQEGRDLAVEKSFVDANLDQSVAFGSSRVRTQETAGFMLAGKEDDITGAESLDDLRAKIDKDAEVGSKIGIDKRLDFTDSDDTPGGKALNEAYARGEYVKHMVETSDTLSKETGDSSGANYSYKASQIARIVDKYVHVLPRWQELVNDPAKNYSESLERYLSTHLGMSEAFLAKVVEVTEGAEMRDAFVAMIGNKGFDYLEGFEVDIEKKNGIETITVKYKTDKGEMTKELSSEQLNAIIQS
ncbi:MAG: hypothetical protein WDN09_03360 [bacterium]